MRTIGLIGGMSWQSSRLYYDRINQGVVDRLGGLHSASLVMVSVDFAPLAQMQAESRWREAGDLMADAARRLAAAGAEVIAIGANTMHKAAREAKAATTLPFLHIGDPLAKALRADGRSRPLLLGTRFTMEDDFMRDHLSARGLDVLTPQPADREALHAIIYDELVKGVVTAASRARVRAMIDDAGEREADGVIFGCTEIGLLFPPSDAGLPGYDTLELHAAGLVDFALS